MKCAAACNACAAACLHERDVEPLRLCISLDVQCAEVCVATARLLNYPGEFSTTMAKFCSNLCRVCAEECEKHAAHGMQHCAECAAACRICSDACEAITNATVPSKN
ncbi:hypothetical protein HNQ91_002773 [Filimonas zeae]|uniref:four-helix bundle copper-binding protein n=1 Tax=Filimonas zeae TaxID=1737353 RepID=UPI00166E6CA1|nr:four-helix bundle copper-binding protein [Filimonas zeae]MDR6339708.1 hypothetical protein [Filimonas zeae]